MNALTLLQLSQKVVTLDESYERHYTLLLNTNLVNIVIIPRIVLHFEIVILQQNELKQCATQMSQAAAAD